MKRAMDLSLKHNILPKEEWTKDEEVINKNFNNFKFCADQVEQVERVYCNEYTQLTDKNKNGPFRLPMGS